MYEVHTIRKTHLMILWNSSKYFHGSGFHSKDFTGLNTEFKKSQGFQWPMETLIKTTYVHSPMTRINFVTYLQHYIQMHSVSLCRHSGDNCYNHNNT